MPHQLFVEKPLLYVDDFRKCAPLAGDGRPTHIATRAFHVVCSFGDVINVPSFDRAIISTPEELATQERVRVFALNLVRSEHDPFAIDHESFNRGILDIVVQGRIGNVGRAVLEMITVVHATFGPSGPPVDNR